MERFRRFIGSDLNLESVKNASRINEFGVDCTYLPDPPEDFDEFEFRTGFGGQDNIVITVATELGKVKRILFSEADGDNPDIIRSLSVPRLEQVLSEKGEKIVGLFEFITG